MQTFNTIEEAKEYGVNQEFGEYHFEKAKIKSDDIILCGTDKAYEEQLWSDAYELISDLFEKFCEDLKEDDYSDFATDLATEIRELVLSRFEEEQHIKFINVHDEY